MAFAFGSSQANAAAVSSQAYTIDGPKGGTELRYRGAFAADSGESNRLTVRNTAGVVFTEAALPVRAGSLCTQRGPSSASCPIGDTKIALGDGDDQADADLGFSIDGGEGDDLLSGGQGVLTGGPGHDSIIGKAIPAFQAPDLPDLITNKFMDGEAPERDVYQGAKGNNTVSYQGRRIPVRITMGSTANEDQLNAIGTIIGGDVGDRLTGDAKANTLVGGKGRDRLAGGPGRDVLEGDDDGDRLYGGEGNDKLVVMGGWDKVRCGPGTDRLVPREGFTSPVAVPADCEMASTDDFTVAGRPKRRGRHVEVRLRRIELDDFSRILLFRGRRLVGKSRRVKRKGTYRVKLTKVGRKLARRGRKVVVRNGPAEGPRSRRDEQAYSYRLR